jgi:hypothetical protein
MFDNFLFWMKPWIRSKDRWAAAEALLAATRKDGPSIEFYEKQQL